MQVALPIGERDLRVRPASDRPLQPPAREQFCRRTIELEKLAPDVRVLDRQQKFKRSRPSATPANTNELADPDDWFP
ncbi:MAG: hypothetical protein M3552_03180 [Planctomycetota bacterium]|nr:hypothetical protein [Planctomycetota bacterium]